MVLYSLCWLSGKSNRGSYIDEGGGVFCSYSFELYGRLES